MLNEIIKATKWGGHDFALKTGKIARQCDGSVLVTYGDTVVLCTVAIAKSVKENVDFFPLTVHYRQMAFAAGKIPGGFIKREGKASDREVLVSRLIDRSLRPLFPDNFFYETQIICTVLSYDPNCTPDIAAMVGSSAALAIAGVPMKDTIAAAKIGYIADGFKLNPSYEELEKSDLDIVVAGGVNSILMVEAGSNELSEDKILEAIEFASASFRPIIKLIEDLAEAVAKPMMKLATPADDSHNKQLENHIAANYTEAVEQAFTINDKKLRNHKLDEIKSTISQEHPDETNVGDVFTNLVSAILRKKILHDGIRIGARKYNEIRPIDCEVSLLPRAHGSALFTRGETQSLVAVTLGTSSDEQLIDAIEGSSREHFMLNYIFPPYSVGETSALRAPGRREIGHGRLAWRAFSSVVPKQSDFPYSIRVVSEITSCNGSSSMATICGASLALMSAGVPISSAVAGIAMGLIIENGKHAILSDILGDEDALGDMDFKVAGTKFGITALQMDIKVAGISSAILREALYQAKDGRMHILDKMNPTIEMSGQLSKFAPVIDTLSIEKDKIRDLIGPGGKIIKDLCEKTSCKIDISDDGVVTVAAPNQTSLDLAKGMINAIIFEPKIGDMFDGKVVKIIDSGAFINYIGTRDGFLHISEVSDIKVMDINLHLKVDQVIKVKVIGFDNRGKVRLSLRSEHEKHHHPKVQDHAKGGRHVQANDHANEQQVHDQPHEGSQRFKVSKPFRDKRNYAKEEKIESKTNDIPVGSEKKFFS
jgi:polyribonucleotide nucleotidyltransferase